MSTNVFVCNTRYSQLSSKDDIIHNYKLCFVKETCTVHKWAQIDGKYQAIHVNRNWVQKVMHWPFFRLFVSFCITLQWLRTNLLLIKIQNIPSLEEWLLLRYRICSASKSTSSNGYRKLRNSVLLSHPFIIF